jgi:large subunit ribosomal protein L9
MEIILKQDVRNLGFKDDVVKVKSGYARNFLIPKGFADIATEVNRKVHNETLKQRAFKQEKIKKEAEKIADSLKNVTVKVGAKVGTSGKIFGSVNAIQIAEALKAQYNIDIDRKKIYVDGDSVKEVGNYTAKISLHKEVQVTMNFEVIGE